MRILGPHTRPAVDIVAETSPITDPTLPCKNVDLQTQQLWGSARGRWSPFNSGYLPVALMPDVGVTVGQQAQVMPGTAAMVPKGGVPGPGAGQTSGWFFGMAPSPNPPPDFSSRMLMSSDHTASGSVINLNPSCFGEVYWVGGSVGPVYMLFAVWLPYSRWVQGDLPVIVHFRPYYNDPVYGEAQRNAKGGIPPVLGRDSGGHQPFCDAAWYYLVGTIGFVQQMLATRRLGVVVVPMPPIPDDPRAPSIYPDAFRNNATGILSDVLDEAIATAGSTAAGKVNASLDNLIFTANSQGGQYLVDVAGKTRSGLREIWMFDANGMSAGFGMTSFVRRMYVAQSGNAGVIPQSAPGPVYEKEGDDWSVVDVSKIPSNGSSLHDMCGRLCFSHAAGLSPTLSALKVDPNLMDKTLATSCWPDRQEIWIKRGP